MTSPSHLRSGTASAPALRLGVLRRDNRRSRQSGLSLIELMIAGVVLVVGALAVVGMITMAIGSNNRNKVDSTKTMLAEAVIEQVNSTLIGAGTANITDCAGNNYTINASAGGAKLQGSGTHPNDTLGNDIDFSESSPPANYQMNYVITSPCTTSGSYVATYDVRWHIDQIGEAASTPSNSYLVTVAAKQNGVNVQGNMAGVYFSLPVNMRVVVGRPQ